MVAVYIYEHDLTAGPQKNTRKPSQQSHSATLDSRNMSLSRFFYEPFYTLSDFDRLFDEAFNARASVNGNNQVQRQEANASRALRPRYVASSRATSPSY